MEEVEENPNLIYLHPDLLEEIFLGLPLKSILKFKTVSKQWRSILESRSFAQRRLKLENQKKPKLLAVGNHRSESRFQGDAAEEEVEMVYINCDDAATRPSMTCDGLVCIPVPGSVNILNPSTGESIRFPSGPDPLNRRYPNLLFDKTLWAIFPGYWVMGFGRDIVDGSYKVVRMFFDPSFWCEILDVGIGEWRKVNPPPYKVKPKSAFVKGSIYWIERRLSHSVLALDLHTEEFRDVSFPPTCSRADQLVNLSDRLAIARPYTMPNWRFEIWVIDEQEETWSMAYSICLAGCGVVSRLPWKVWFRPVAICKQGIVYFHDNEKRLFKYDPETDQVRCIATEIRVLSDFVENVVSLQPSAGSQTTEYRYGFQYQDLVRSQDHASKRDQTFGWIKSRMLLTTVGLVSVFIFRHFHVKSRS